MSKFALMLGVAAICGGLVTQAKAETVYFTSENRAYLSDWVLERNGGCPAGSTLIKREHWLRDPSYRCEVLPGQRTVFYRPGTSLPRTVTYTELPSTVVEHLPTAPDGTTYVTSDNNIYLIKPQTRTVVDSVTVVGPPVRDDE